MDFIFLVIVDVSLIVLEFSFLIFNFLGFDFVGVFMVVNELGFIIWRESKGFFCLWDVDWRWVVSVIRLVVSLLFGFFGRGSGNCNGCERFILWVFWIEIMVLLVNNIFFSIFVFILCCKIDV